MRDFREQLALEKAANGERVSLLKRDGAVMTPDDALKISIQSGMDDDAIEDKNAWRDAQIAAYNQHVGKRVDFKKGAEMSISDQTIVAIAKNVVERGAPAVFSKAVYIAAIAKRSDEIRKAGESSAQAFTRCITEDDTGRLLYKASKSGAVGPEIEPAPVEAPKPPELGEAHARMQVLADDHRKANPRLSPAGAYAHIYSHPDNKELREQCKAEHFAAISKAMAA